MSKRVPLSRCKRCVHYRGRTCPLQDLDPCRYTPRDPDDDRARDLFLIAVCAVGVSVILLTIMFHYTIF